MYSYPFILSGSHSILVAGLCFAPPPPHRSTAGLSSDWSAKEAIFCPKICSNYRRGGGVRRWHSNENSIFRQDNSRNIFRKMNWTVFYKPPPFWSAWADCGCLRSEAGLQSARFQLRDLRSSIQPGGGGDKGQYLRAKINSTGGGGKQ